jgi:hypothetical protein
LRILTSYIMNRYTVLKDKLYNLERSISEIRKISFGNTLILEKLNGLDKYLTEIRSLYTDTCPPESNREIISTYIHNHPAPRTREQVVIPRPTDDHLVYQTQIITAIVKKANGKLNPSMFANMKTFAGETQLGGKKGEHVIEEVLKDLGMTYKKAPPQQPCDFRNVRSTSDPLGYQGLYFDSKKMDSKKIMLNDSIPKKWMWYIIFSTKQKRCIAIHCNMFRKDPEVEKYLEEYKRTIECQRYDYKKCGPFTAAARMNLSLDVMSYITDYSTDVFV